MLLESLSVFYHLACTSWLLHQSIASRNHIHLSKVAETLKLMSAHHYPGSWSRRQGNKIQVTQSNSSFSIPLRIPGERSAIRMQTSLPVGTAPSRSPCSRHLGALQSDWSTTLQCLSWLEFRNACRQSYGAGPARRNGCMDSYKDASPSHIHQQFSLISGIT